jgi:hypothetical protein
MILPLVIIVLILVCAYLEYQKNINMNNKVVICIICILTFVLCMGFVEKYRNRTEGFQNNDEYYFSENSLESKEVKEKCDSKSTKKNQKRPTLTYDINIPNIKDYKKKREFLKDYEKHIKEGVKPCWKIKDYIQCNAIINKSQDDLSDDDKKIKKLCIENKPLFDTCIETKIIEKYDKELEESDLSKLIEKANYLSIDTKDLNKETLIKKITEKEGLRYVLKDIRLGDNNYKNIKKETEDLIKKYKSEICNNCRLTDEEPICKYKFNTSSKTLEETAKVARDAAIEAEKAAKAANGANMFQTVEDSAAAEAATIAAEAAYAAANAAENAAKQESKSVEERNQDAITADQKGAEQEAAITERIKRELYAHIQTQNINPSMENNLEGEQKIKREMYVKPTSLGHITDKYYSSLDNKPPGYSYMDPKLWNVPQKRQPVCHYKNDLSAVPLYDSGTHINVLELTPYGDIATSEKDVMQTNIGSILPSFQYREFI